MIESAIALLIITSVFLCLFKLSHLLTGKILLEHAAMRVARARAVGMNDFMCVKNARLCTLPIAGKCLWPSENIDVDAEIARQPIYLMTADEPLARGIMQYAGWERLAIDPNDCTHATAEMNFRLLDDWEFSLEGEAGVEDNWSLYLGNSGK